MKVAVVAAIDGRLLSILFYCYNSFLFWRRIHEKAYFSSAQIRNEIHLFLYEATDSRP